jgi:epoxyqueuosine reductase
MAIAKAEVVRQGGPGLAVYPRAVSIGIRLFDEIVDRLPDRERMDVAVSYRHHCYDAINDRLDDIASLVAGELQRAGYRAYSLLSSKRVDSERICALFSHKLAAHLAGLGWIGKSCLLVTPEHGPRVRFVSVLTDAPLDAGVPMDEACGDCTECAEICPTSAIIGHSFDENEPREARFDAWKCESYLNSTEQSGRSAVCGMCLYVCPHGRK